MKKVFFSLIFLLFLAAFGRAESQLYLVFETTNGSKIPFNAQNLIMNVNGTVLDVTNDETSAKLTLSELTKMYFSTDISAINSPEISPKSESVEIFSLSGISLGKHSSSEEAKKALSTGVYIFKSESGTSKSSVK